MHVPDDANFRIPVIRGNDHGIHQKLGGCDANFWVLAFLCKFAHLIENLLRFVHVNLSRCLVLEERPKCCEGLTVRGVWIQCRQQ